MHSERIAKSLELGNFVDPNSTFEPLNLQTSGIPTVQKITEPCRLDPCDRHPDGEDNPRQEIQFRKKYQRACQLVLDKGTWLTCVSALTSLEPKVSHDIRCARMHRDIDALLGYWCRGRTCHIVSVLDAAGSAIIIRGQRLRRTVEDCGVTIWLILGRQTALHEEPGIGMYRGEMNPTTCHGDKQ